MCLCVCVTGSDLGHGVATMSRPSEIYRISLAKEHIKPKKNMALFVLGFFQETSEIYDGCNLLPPHIK